MTDRPEIVLRLTRLLARSARTEALPLRLCRGVVDVVEARDGAVSLGFSTPERTLLCASSDQAAQFEDLQDLVREGPSLDAFSTGAAVLSVGRDDQTRRWPSLAAALEGRAHDGVVRALPMRPGNAVVGVLTLHHAERTRTPLEDDQLQFLADAVGAAIIGDFPGRTETTLWSERDRISQATGMVVAQLDLDPPDALAVLRAHAFAQEASVVEISRRVLERELDFRGDVGGAR